MTVKQIYIKYLLSQYLQAHLLRVAALVEIITEK